MIKLLPRQWVSSIATKYRMIKKSLDQGCRGIKKITIVSVTIVLMVMLMLVLARMLQPFHNGVNVTSMLTLDLITCISVLCINYFRSLMLECNVKTPEHF
jgi:hypothetical protein